MFEIVNRKSGKKRRFSSKAKFIAALQRGAAKHGTGAFIGRRIHA